MSKDRTTPVRQTRRDFLKTSTVAAAAAGTVPFWFATGTDHAAAFSSPNERPHVGCIGTGSQWQGYDGPRAMDYFNCVAVCDVDSAHAAKGRDLVKNKQGKKGKDFKLDVTGDYRRILDRKDIDVVTIVTPDHWHTKIAIDAMRAGKDVYCEKPLTLTIEEGKQIIKVLEETKRVFQVGTQQRSEMHLNFLKAIAMVQDGRIGQVKRAICDIGGAPTSGKLPRKAPPSSLNWDMWLGQAPRVDYMERRLPGKRGKEADRNALPLRVSLVVRILGGKTDRLGGPSCRHRAMGDRHGPLGTDAGRAPACEASGPLQERLSDRRR